MKHSLFTLAAFLFFIQASTAQKKNSLEGKKITTLEITCDKTIAVSPDNVIPIGIAAHSEKGNDLSTTGMLNGKTSWDDFMISVTGGRFNEGNVIINSDPRSFKEHKVIVKATDKFDETKMAELVLNVNYDKNYTLNLNGKDGDNGEPGLNGKAGSSPPERGNGDGDAGRNGEHGRNGRDGRDGGNAPAISAWMMAYDDAALNAKMLKIKVKDDNTGKEYFYLVYADKNIINISANGGKGGNGGSGGIGGNGGKGATGGYQSPSEPGVQNGRGGDGGDGGNAGNGGSGGNGGNGGTIKLYVDPSAAAYAGNIRFTNRMGKPGLKGPAGTFGERGLGGQGGLGPGRDGVKGEGAAEGVDGKAGLDGTPAVIQNVPVTIEW